MRKRWALQSAAPPINGTSAKGHGKGTGHGHGTGKGKGNGFGSGQPRAKLPAMTGSSSSETDLSASGLRIVQTFDDIKRLNPLAPGVASVRGNADAPPMLFAYPRNDQYIGPTLKFNRRPVRAWK